MRGLSDKWRHKLTELLQMMQEKDFIAPSHLSPDPATALRTGGVSHLIAYTLVVREHKSTPLRFCMDGRDINPSISQGLQAAVNYLKVMFNFVWGRWVWTSDIIKAFWQVPLHPGAVIWTGMVVGGLIWKWLVLPFGLCCSSRGLEGLLSQGLSDHCYYVDNICFTASNLGDLVIQVNKAVKFIEGKGFKLNPDQTVANFSTSDMDMEMVHAGKSDHNVGFLGYKWRVDKDLMCQVWKIDDDLVRKVKVYDITKKELASLVASWYDPLGLFAADMCGLRYWGQKLLLGNIGWNDKITDQQGLQKLAEFIDLRRNFEGQSPRFLGPLPDSNETWIAMCDSSEEGWACGIFNQQCLPIYQKYGYFPSGKESGTIPYKEMFAFKRATDLISHFKDEVKGLPGADQMRILLLSDSTITLHRVLNLSDSGDLTVKERNLLKAIRPKIMEHQLRIGFIPTKLNMVDVITRPTVLDYQYVNPEHVKQYLLPLPRKNDTIKKINLRGATFYQDLARGASVQTKQDPPTSTPVGTADPPCTAAEILTQQEEVFCSAVDFDFLPDDMTKKVIDIPKVGRRIVIDKNSPQVNEICSRYHKIRHQGVQRTMKDIKKVYHIARLRRAVKEVVLRCVACQKTRPIKKKWFWRSQRAHQILSKVWTWVSVDFIEGLPPLPAGFDQVFTYAMIIMDLMTRFIFTMPLCEIKKEMVQEVLEACFTTYGYPRVIVSDQASTFMSLQKHYIEKGCLWLKSFAYAPAQKGVFERMNRSIKEMIRSRLVEKRTHDWVDELKQVTLLLNTTEYSEFSHQSLTPSDMNLNYRPRIPGEDSIQTRAEFFEESRSAMTGFMELQLNQKVQEEFFTAIAARKKEKLDEHRKLFQHRLSRSQG
ncbi:MAG: hypothetical protein WCQ60_03505, partial [bacterium]